MLRFAIRIAPVLFAWTVTVTDPFPEPELGETVAQVLSLLASHGQDAFVETLSVKVAPLLAILAAGF